MLIWSELKLLPPDHDSVGVSVLTTAPPDGEIEVGETGVASVKPPWTTQPCGLFAQFTSHQVYSVPWNVAFVGPATIVPKAPLG
jgi:hypothetical protein